MDKSRRQSLIIHTCIMLLLAPAFIFWTSCRSTTPHADSTQTFTFVQLCDPQLGFSDYEQDKTSLRQAVRQINTLNPDFVVLCGDMVNTADNRSYADFKDIMGGLAMPYYCVPGNHDVGNEPTAESLRNYRTTIGRDYFVHEHKGTAFVFINTQLIKQKVPAESDHQDAWLRENLRIAFEKGCPVFIVGHFPFYCQNADEPEAYMNLPLEKRTELLDLFAQYNVTAVLGGHTHRLILNNSQTLRRVNGATHSRNFDDRPLGFRLWHVNHSGLPDHQFVPLESPLP
jgi:3',5'-cyclic AMP phosphodiesterase CpdA